MGVLEGHGPALLERYPLQGLSWEQVKELKGPNLVGLGMGSGPAPGELACLAHICSLSLSLSHSFQYVGEVICSQGLVLRQCMPMHAFSRSMNPSSMPCKYLHACLLADFIMF